MCCHLNKSFVLTGTNRADKQNRLISKQDSATMVVISDSLRQVTQGLILNCHKAKFWV